MKRIVKSREEDEDADDSCPLSRLPDEIILQILTKLIDLKTLCFCSLVSRRFSTIVLQVDAISFTTPLINPPIPDNNTFRDVARSKPLHPVMFLWDYQPFRSAFNFLYKFRAVKSLCIELSSSSRIGNDSRFLFKWRAKFGNRIDSVFFLLPDSVSDTDDGKGEEEEDMVLSNHLIRQKKYIAYKYLTDVVSWHFMLMKIVKYLPTMLEEVSITDSGRRGRLSLSRGKLAEVKESEMELTKAVVIGMSECDIPVLKLPVSGYVMKGITLFVITLNDLQGGVDSLTISEDGFEDKEEAVYTEAVMEILKNHKGKIQMIY